MRNKVSTLLCNSPPFSKQTEIYLREKQLSNVGFSRKIERNCIKAERKKMRIRVDKLREVGNELKKDFVKMKENGIQFP